MIDKETVLVLSYGDVLHHRWARNADGTPERWRINGKVKTWKTRPNDFTVPVKHGLKYFSYITQAEIHHFCTTDKEVYKLEAMEKFRKLQYDRKPATWDEVNKAISWTENKKHLKHLIRYYTDNLWFENDPEPFTTFNYQPDDMIFILEILDGNTYLIKTEGYDYCRYAMQIL